MDPKKAKNIIEGFEDDFEAVANEFLMGSQSLSAFLDQWEGQNLDCLFANRFDPRELLEAISNMNVILVQILTDRQRQVEVRIAALYFLFCLFIKQPNRLNRKIRLTCDDASGVQNLIVELETDFLRDDAEFVWKYLRVSDALDVVEERLVYGPSMLVDRKPRTFNPNRAVQEELSEEAASAEELLRTKIEPSVSFMDSLSTTYNQIRKDLGLGCVEVDDPHIQSAESLGDSLGHAKALITEFRTTIDKSSDT